MLKSSLGLAVALSLFGCSRSALELGEIDDRDDAPAPHLDPPPAAKPPFHFTVLGYMPGSASTEWTALSADGVAVAGVARFNDGVNWHIAPVRSVRSELERFDDDQYYPRLTEALDVSTDGSVVFGKGMDLDTPVYFVAWL
jgi:hypothetical protein